MKIAILCGGHGKRLRPYTEDIPKVLVPISGKPILEHILDLYLSKQLCDFILCIGYKGGKIREFVKQKSFDRTACSIVFSDSGERASMLTRIYRLAEHFDDRIMISYGDTLTNLDIQKFMEYHKTKKALVSIVTAKIQSPFGLVEYDGDGLASSFNEKPLLNYYIGHMIIEKIAFDLVTDDMLAMPDGAGLVHFLKLLTDRRELAVYEYHGKQITFNTHVEKERAEEMMKSFYTMDEEE
jgi:NDP-sugar pyrophosphorylase family protein